MEIKENIRENIKVFHCNDKQSCKKFLKEDDYLIWSEEKGIWLGSGMYFWDNLSNAKYWRKEKQKDTHFRKSFSIVSANIYIDNLLDLSDKETCDEIGHLWEAYCKIAGKSSENVPLGEKLNALFSFSRFKKKFSKFTVIRIIGKYYRTPPNALYCYDIRSKFSEPILAAKYIYNVKNSNCIFNKRLEKE